MSVLTHAPRRIDLRREAVRRGHALGYLRHDPTVAIAVVLALLLSYLVLAPIGWRAASCAAYSWTITPFISRT